ncbi:GNAT family N-acetyltransferase [Hymenobacter psoromatis]|uniref:GNAT family N-acetyltransferase n=1 Tax=Hymenobacter psoromatis TaxID=1484116 RepID=UPI001CBBEB7F|nr:GNAT family N-acetyltransferase [Hymenobacter psoromatis]
MSPPPAAIIIQPLEAAQTYALRHAVLWPDKLPAYVHLPDDDAGQHFGAVVGGQLRAVISLFIGPDGTARFRKFATEPLWQGRGLGTALLRHVLAVARAQGAHTLWCDARHNTLPFYQRFGLLPAGEIFYKGDIPYQRLSCGLVAY